MKKKKQTTDFNDYELFERVKQDLKQEHQKIIEDKTTYNNNEFADWLFNQLVRAERRDKQDWSLNYLCALKQYALVGLSHPQQYQQRLYAFKLEIIATETMAGWNTHLLILRGEESEQDFESEMTVYKERLNAIGHDEATIIKMLEYRIKLNYGTD